MPPPPVDLSGVPETLLGNLGRRAAAARAGALRDPMAIQVVDQLDYDFAELTRGALLHAVRVATFDKAVHQFLVSHPTGTVVALGEGLETQFWRVDNGQMRWLTWTYLRPCSFVASCCETGHDSQATRDQRSISVGLTRCTPPTRYSSRPRARGGVPLGGRVNLTERQRGRWREPAQPAVSDARTPGTPGSASLFVAVVRAGSDDRDADDDSQARSNAE